MTDLHPSTKEVSPRAAKLQAKNSIRRLGDSGREPQGRHHRQFLVMANLMAAASRPGCFGLGTKLGIGARHASIV